MKLLFRWKHAYDEIDKWCLRANGHTMAWVERCGAKWYAVATPWWPHSRPERGYGWANARGARMYAARLYREFMLMDAASALGGDVAALRPKA